MPSIASSNSNPLIVDFPSSSPPRNDSYHTHTTKSVHFANFCEGKYIPYPSPREKSERWYTKKQMRRFKKEVCRDALSCSRSILELRKAQQDKPDTKTVKDFLTLCVGIEHLLSRDLQQQYESIKDTRKKHFRTVLEEQVSQIESGTCSVERLASVSKESSLSARKKSLKRAKMTLLTG